MAQFKEYHSFGGVDIRAVLGDQEFGELQMVSYRLERDKTLIHTLGSPDARSIARGKRYISGACVFIIFDRDSLLEAMDRQGRSNVWLGKHETANYQRGGYGLNGLTSAGRTAADNGGTATGGLNVMDTSTLNTPKAILDKLTTATRARLSDQLLPFDITLVGANEFGHTTKMVIYGVEITSEAGGVSIDDMSIEKQHQFLARSIGPWEAIDTWNSVDGTSTRVTHPLAGKQSAVGRTTGSTGVSSTVNNSSNTNSSVYSTSGLTTVAASGGSSLGSTVKGN